MNRIELNSIRMLEFTRNINFYLGFEINLKVIRYVLETALLCHLMPVTACWLVVWLHYHEVEQYSWPIIPHIDEIHPELNLGNRRQQHSVMLCHLKDKCGYSLLTLKM